MQETAHLFHTWNLDYLDRTTSPRDRDGRPGLGLDLCARRLKENLKQLETGAIVRSTNSAVKTCPGTMSSPL